ncbi:MAG: cytochrome c biogenesis protein CcdA, partial [Candidatus Paceibacterota bacterium]
MLSTSLLIGSFIAGILTFLAPCTFPLIPAYIGFITGDGKLTKLQTIRNG